MGRTTIAPSRLLSGARGYDPRQEQPVQATIVHQEKLLHGPEKEKDPLIFLPLRDPF